MNPRLLELYNQELHHVRESAAEFAKEYPKIASRLTLSGMDCADPYVERLLEGFAYLTARVQLKLDAEYPTFTHNLLEIAYPHYLAPTPSMTVVQLQTDPDEGSLAGGFPLPRDTVLRAALGRETQTCCEYRTAHPVTLWPLQVSNAEYFGNPAAVLGRLAASEPKAKAGLRLTLRTGAELPFNSLDLDTLPLYLSGARMSGMYPISSIAAGMGLNVTLASYAGSMDFGFVGNGVALPHLPELARHTREAFDELKAAAAILAPPPEPKAADKPARKVPKKAARTARR